MKSFPSNSLTRNHRKVSDNAAGILKKMDQDSMIESFSKNHQNKAVEHYDDWTTNFVKKVEEDLKSIKKYLNAELGMVIKKLDHKMKGNYSSSLSDFFTDFHMESEIKNEEAELYKAITKLKEKINSYINNFCENILNRNIDKSNSTSLYHFSSEIKSQDKNWNTASSRSALKKAEITVTGFNRPQTTWLALGVTKTLKEYGPMKSSSFSKEDFMGYIYLNGSDEMTGGLKLKKDLNNNDVFVVECQNRMVYVYRKSEGKNKKEAFIMDDNIEYYIYVGIKGPIELKFVGE